MANIGTIVLSIWVGMLYVGLIFVCICCYCCSHIIFTCRQTQLSPGDSTESAERDSQDSDTTPNSYYSDYFSYNSESVSATGSHTETEASQSQGNLNLDVDRNHENRHRTLNQWRSCARALPCPFARLRRSDVSHKIIYAR